jgi:Flp pilus assembly protein TadG
MGLAAAGLQRIAAWAPLRLAGAGRLRRHRAAAVTVLFAAASLPVLGVAGLAIDYSIWNEANAQMSLAANVAALNAVKVAASGLLANDPNDITEGQTSGRGWFLSAVGTPYATSAITPTVAVAINNSTVTANVSFTAHVASVFGGLLFGIKYYNVSNAAAASITTAPYVNVEMLIDNSSSMDIGAANSDIQTLMSLSACDPSNAIYNGSNASDDGYSNYAITGSSATYPGPTQGFLTAPFTATVGNTTQTFIPGTDPTCTLSNTVVKNGVTPKAGPPCAFACHWDNRANLPVGQYQDLYGMARNTLGTANPVTLRIDIVKNATNALIDTMKTDNLSINNLKVGLFTFNTDLSQIYPASGEAGADWASAKDAVGTPPTTPASLDTGYQPAVALLTAGNVVNNDTNFVESMNTLASNYLTKAGTGATSSAPRKVLIIITDGFEDDSINGARQAFPPSACTQFKNMGYIVYVVFTPYYPLELINMFNTGSPEVWQPMVMNGEFNSNTSDTSSIYYNLQQCASAPADFASAADQSTLTSVLAGFLKTALNAPATFTQ